MESHDDHGSQIAELAEAIFGAYLHLRQMLGALPIPVELPLFGVDPAIEAGDALMALQRAREVIEDEPIGGLYTRAYDKLILEWFTTYELLAITMAAGPAPWRLDCVRVGLIRVGLTAEMIERGELDGLDGA